VRNDVRSEALRCGGRLPLRLGARGHRLAPGQLLAVAAVAPRPVWGLRLPVSVLDLAPLQAQMLAGADSENTVLASREFDDVYVQGLNCVVTAAGPLFCWPMTSRVLSAGRIGPGPHDDGSFFVPVPNVTGAARFVSVQCASNDVIGLLDNGGIVVQFGVGAFGATSTLAAYDPGPYAQMQQFHLMPLECCAIRMDGELECWLWVNPSSLPLFAPGLRNLTAAKQASRMCGSNSACVSTGGPYKSLSLRGGGRPFDQFMGAQACVVRLSDGKPVCVGVVRLTSLEWIPAGAQWRMPVYYTNLLPSPVAFGDAGNDWGPSIPRSDYRKLVVSMSSNFGSTIVYGLRNMAANVTLDVSPMGGNGPVNPPRNVLETTFVRRTPSAPVSMLPIPPLYFSRDAWAASCTEATPLMISDVHGLDHAYYSSGTCVGSLLLEADGRVLFGTDGTLDSFLIGGTGAHVECRAMYRTGPGLTDGRVGGLFQVDGETRIFPVLPPAKFLYWNVAPDYAALAPGSMSNFSLLTKSLRAECWGSDLRTQGIGPYAQVRDVGNEFRRRKWATFAWTWSSRTPERQAEAIDAPLRIVSQAAGLSHPSPRPAPHSSPAKHHRPTPGRDTEARRQPAGRHRARPPGRRTGRRRRTAGQRRRRGARPSRR
jgi:hypothetical protein